jgi:hypothetical protein
LSGGARSPLGLLGLLAAVTACEPVGVDLDAVIAIQVSLPDSGVVEEGDTIVPVAVAYNGYGDPVPADFVWATADTANLEVLDSVTGATRGRQPPSGKLQARVGSLRSSLLTVTVRPQADTLYISGAQRLTVTLPDSQSGDLQVKLEDLTTGSAPAGLANRPVVFRLTYPGDGGAFTLLPGDTVLTGAGGLASVEVRLLNRLLPDSAVVEARAVRANGQTVPGSSVTFVVEFQP